MGGEQAVLVQCEREQLQRGDGMAGRDWRSQGGDGERGGGGGVVTVTSAVDVDGEAVTIDCCSRGSGAPLCILSG